MINKPQPLTIHEIEKRTNRFLTNAKVYLFNKYGLAKICTDNINFIVEYYNNKEVYNSDKEFIDTYTLINKANDSNNELAKRIAHTSVTELNKRIA